MAAFRAIFSAKRRGRSKFLPVVAGLCLVLLASLAFAQVAHLHASAADADHCQLCIVMHTAAPAAAVSAAIILVNVGATAPLAEPVIVARQRILSLFIRPPPVSC